MTEPAKTGGRRRPSDEEILNSVPSSSGGREVRVGIFVLLGLVSFVIVLFLLTDPATLRGRYMLVTEVADAGGIRRGDPIQIRGVNVGRIHGFEMQENGRVAISLEMEGRWQMPVGSSTRMGASGIFGGRTMEVVPGSASTMHEPGDTLPEGGEGAGGIMGSAEELGDRATAVLGRIETLMDEGTITAVQGSAGELEGLLTELSAMTLEQRGALKRLTESLARSAEGLEDAAASGPDVARAIARADSAMAGLSETSANLDAAAQSLRGLLERIDRGEGTLGRLAQDDALYENLNRAAESVATLMDDVQANPSKYINVSLF